MRLKVTVAYDGSGYAGWQRQPDRATVQGQLECAASRIADAAVRVMGAGRTDAGVHAAGQVAHLEGRVESRCPSDWLRGLNALLPKDIRVVSVDPVDDDFHARFDARRKTYRYHVDRASIASPFLARYAWHLPGPLDLEAMHEAAVALSRGIDQLAFSSRPEPGSSPRSIDACVIDDGPPLTVTVTGRSFLRYAVRGIVGSLAEVGRGQLDPGLLADAAMSGRRDDTGPPAPAHGLVLVRVDYDNTR